MPINSFDKIAFIYDLLARLVFGSSIVRSQKYFLRGVPEHSNVLILGGGTGWLLAELLKLKPNCRVWYIEASSKMIAMTKERTKNNPKVYFIHATEPAIPSSLKFDAVITNFYLDLFTEATLTDVVNSIQTSIKSGGLWIATDFIASKKWWQSPLLKIMYAFFHLVCSIEPKQLPKWGKAIQGSSMTKLKSSFFYYGFIESVLFTKTKLHFPIIHPS